MFKKMDIIIIVVLMILSFIPEIVFGIVLGKEYNSTYAEITIAGELYKNVPLSSHSGKDIIEIKSKDGINIVEIENNSIAIVEADCKDKICMNPGHIDKPGQSLVCLPNRVMVEIKGKIDDDIIISH